ncbi:MAG: DUF1987 domain-containing protein [Bacteroidales bacterium]|jgi:hypothetical protein|nr:DUF1987 domain-containing protein [Bacteroidales bacterium]
MRQVRTEILPTANTPYFLLDPEGIIRIKGKGMVINETNTLNNIYAWLDLYVKSPAEITYVSICLEYLNSFCTGKLVTILKKLMEVVADKKKLVIYWYYEEDDNDILERGEYISSTFNIPFKFIMTDDIGNCC